MKVDTESTCRTREEARAGERDKPHFFIDSEDMVLTCAGGPGVWGKCCWTTMVRIVDGWGGRFKTCAISD